jgi:hypothetical protein
MYFLKQYLKCFTQEELIAKQKRLWYYIWGSDLNAKTRLTKSKNKNKRTSIN